MADDIISWIAREILPYERRIRRWLGRAEVPASDADDLIQEAYCRIAAARPIAPIVSGEAYFLTTVRNILRQKMRRERIVRIESLAEIASLNVLDMEPSAERQLAGAQLLRRVSALIDQLPERRRRVLMLRRIEGLSQRETAERLNITENIVEKDLAKAIRAILEQLTDQAHDSEVNVRKQALRGRIRNH